MGATSDTRRVTFVLNEADVEPTYLAIANETERRIAQAAVDAFMDGVAALKEELGWDKNPQAEIHSDGTTLRVTHGYAADLARYLDNMTDPDIYPDAADREVAKTMAYILRALEGA